MVRERWQMGPPAQADDDNRGFARRSQGHPPPRAYADGAQVHGLVIEIGSASWGEAQELGAKQQFWTDEDGLSPHRRANLQN